MKRYRKPLFLVSLPVDGLQRIEKVLFRHFLIYYNNSFHLIIKVYNIDEKRKNERKNTDQRGSGTQFYESQRKKAAFFT